MASDRRRTGVSGDVVLLHAISTNGADHGDGDDGDKVSDNDALGCTLVALSESCKLICVQPRQMRCLRNRSQPSSMCGSTYPKRYLVHASL